MTSSFLINRTDSAVMLPFPTVANAVMKQRRFGKDLRKQLAAQLSRQVRFSLAIEQLPDPSNRVSVDRRFLDPLGNPRPAINYSIDEYTLGGLPITNARAYIVGLNLSAQF